MKAKELANEVWQSLEMLGFGLKSEIVGAIVIIIIAIILLTYGSC